MDATVDQRRPAATEDAGPAALVVTPRTAPGGLARRPGAPVGAPAGPVIRIASGTRRRFRDFRRSRPFWAAVLTILGAYCMGIGPISVYQYVFISAVLWEAIFVAVLVAILGLFLLIAPGLARLLGALIMALSVVSFVTCNFGGFIIGMVLGIVGGGMAMSWVPRIVDAPTGAGTGHATSTSLTAVQRP